MPKKNSVFCPNLYFVLALLLSITVYDVLAVLFLCKG